MPFKVTDIIIIMETELPYRVITFCTGVKDRSGTMSKSNEIDSIFFRIELLVMPVHVGLYHQISHSLRIPTGQTEASTTKAGRRRRFDFKRRYMYTHLPVLQLNNCIVSSVEAVRT